MSSYTAKANQAANEALQVGANPRDLQIAREYMGTKNFIGYCQAFVNRVTGGATSGASAIQAWNNAQNKVQGTQGIRPGDLVYFSPNASNRGYGHTGIYAGNGQMVSATDNGVKQSNLMDWIKQTGQQILGYVPAAERAVGNFFGGLFGQSQSQPQPSMQPPTPQQAIAHNVQMRSAGLNSSVPIPTPPTPISNTPIPSTTSQINLDPNKQFRTSGINLNPSQPVS